MTVETIRFGAAVDVNVRLTHADGFHAYLAIR
jgi:hypothetical protein